MTEKCHRCGNKEVESYCCMCGKPLCIICLRTPDPDHQPEDTNDYCIEDYCQEGYGDLWEMTWTNPQYGDNMYSVFDTPPGLHPFEIPATYGIPQTWASSWKRLIGGN